MINPDPTASLNGMLSGIGELGNNVINLSALQAQLASQDLRESASRARPALIAMAILIPVGLSAVTLGLFGVAYWASARFDMTLGSSMLVTAGVSVVVVALGMFISIRRFTSSLSSFRRSREELERNIAWLRTVMMYGAG